MIIVVDNTVLSNFAQVGRMDLLEAILGSRAAVTPQVMAEFQAGIDVGKIPACNLGWLRPLSLTPEEQAVYDRLLLRLNAGEAACLAVTLHRSGRLLTDDRDARSFAGRAGIGVSGTLGVLAHLAREERLTVAAADEILGQMIDRGYHSPVDTISGLL